MTALISKIAAMLEYEDDEFNVNEAAELLRDVSVELSHELEIGRTLGKLEKRIKDHMKETGEMPDVPGVTATITPKKPVIVVKSGSLPALYEYLGNKGDLKALAFFEQKQYAPAISLKVE